MRQFLPYIHFLRGVAILYVVSVHTRGFSSYWQSSPEVYNFLDTFSDPSEGNGTTMFLFIGGFLFQYLTRQNFHYGKYLKQKFKILIMPYLIISIPLLLFRFQTDFASLFLPENFHERSIIHQVAHFLFTGAHLPPFWFISTIILFYFTAPILHAIDNDKFYKFVFPLILLASLFTYRPEHNANPFLSYLHFIPVYITGMCAAHYKDRILTDRGWPLLTLLFIYLALCYGELSGWITMSRDITFEYVISQGALIFNIYFLKTIVLCFLLLTFFYLLRDRKMPTLELLGNYSFGIFFVHYFFISISRKIFELKGVQVDFSFLSYMLYFLIVMAISIAAVYAVKKVAGPYSRNIIGS